MSTSLTSRVSNALRPVLGNDPLAGFQQEMDKLLTRFRADWNGDWPALPAAPSLDLTETDDSLQIRMDVPGVKPDEINIEVSGNTIRIHGEHKEEKEEKGKTFHRMERSSGAFSRVLTLPAAVKEDQVRAECTAGVLTVTLPKTEVVKPRKVPVQGNGK